MKVRVAGAMSRAVQVESGVPQGSVLGPVLFLLYINHAVAELTCRYKIFADDVKIYVGLVKQGGETNFEFLQDNINKFVKTSASWNLRINPNKCAAIRFTARNSSPRRLALFS